MTQYYDLIFAVFIISFLLTIFLLLIILAVWLNILCLSFLGLLVMDHNLAFDQIGPVKGPLIGLIFSFYFVVKGYIFFSLHRSV